MTPFFTVDFMKLVLYKNISADNSINKVLTDGTSFNINLKQQTDIVNPDIYLTTLTGIDYTDFNYAEIVELKRFYFIDSIGSVNASIFKLELRTDVLETYKAEIDNCLVRVKRGLKTGDYVSDQLLTEDRKTISKIYGDVELIPENNLIITTIGG